MDTTTIVLMVVVFLFSLSVHESAHAWTAWRWGDDTGIALGRVSLNPIRHIDPIGTVLLPLILLWQFHGAFLFGYAKPVPYNPYRMRNPQLGAASTAAAGPLSNLLIAVVAALSLGLAARAGRVEDTLGETLLWRMLSVNVTLGLFNLFPVAPLDGGTVVAGLLPRRAAHAWAQVERLGPILFVLVIVFGGRLLWPAVEVVTDLLLRLSTLAAGRTVTAPLPDPLAAVLREGVLHG